MQQPPLPAPYISPTPFKNTCNLQFYSSSHRLRTPVTREKPFEHKSSVCWWHACMFCADYCHAQRRAIEHVLIKIARAGQNAQLGNELQLQRMKSNYINCLPVDRPFCFLLQRWDSPPGLYNCLRPVQLTATYCLRPVWALSQSRLKAGTRN